MHLVAQSDSQAVNFWGLFQLGMEWWAISILNIRWRRAVIIIIIGVVHCAHCIFPASFYNLRDI